MSGQIALASPTVYAISYARITGRKEQRDSALSIPAQERFIREAMDREGAVFMHAESDILQGTRADRPGYQRVLAAVRRLAGEGKTVAVFVLRLDRFGRDTEERSRAWKELTKAGARLYAIRQSGWVTERFLYDLDAALAAREVELVGARIRDVNEFVRAHGFPIVGRPAWGYQIRPATPDERAAGAGHAMLEPHPLEADAARQAWKLRAAGKSLGEVHRFVMGLPAEQVGRRRLARATFRRMFSAAVYVSRQDYPEKHPGGAVPVLERPRAKWEPLIDDETYRLASSQGDEHRKRPKQASGRHLLTGLLRCHRCGRRMTGRLHRAHGRETPRYACVTANGGRNVYGAGGCTTVVTAETIDAGVRQKVRAVIDAVNQPKRLREIDQLWDHLRREARATDDAPARLERAEQRRAKWADARAEAYADWKAGEITKTEYDEMRARAGGEVEDAEREIERARAALAESGAVVERVLPKLTTVLTTVGGWAALFDDADISDRRAVLAALIERVEPIPVRRGVYRVRITWTALGRSLRKIALTLARADRSGQRVTVETLAWANVSTITQSDAPPGRRPA